MFDMQGVVRPRAMALAIALVLGLSACGGGGGGGSNVRPSPPPTDNPTPPADPDFNVNVDDTTVWPDGHDGTGALNKGGKGTLVVTGTNTYTGGTTIDEGALQIGDGGTTGSIVGDVANEGSLVFNRSDDIAFGGVVSGSGSLAQIGSGTLLLTGANTYSGGTTVSGGILEVAAGGALGTGSVTLDGALYNATLQVDKGASLSNHIVMLGTNAFLDNYGAIGGDVDNAVYGPGGIYATVISQEGGSIKANGAAVSLKEGMVANYSGSTIEGGTLGVSLSHGGSVVNEDADSFIRSSEGIAVKITGGRGIVFNQDGGTITGGSTAIYLGYGGQITNRSGSTIETTGTTTGSCQDTGNCSIFVPTDSDSPHSLSLFNAGTIIGNVQLDAAASNFLSLVPGGSIQGDLDMGLGSGSVLILNNVAGAAQLYSQAVTGTTTFAGLLDKVGDGTWIIDNDELDEANRTWIEGGTLQVGAGGTKGSIGQGDINIYDGSLVFDRSDDVSFAGEILNMGEEGSHTSLVQAGGGRLTLAGGVRSLDNITIESGILQVGNGGTSGSIDGDVVNDGVLVFDRSDDVRFDGSMSGSGSLVKNGAGVLILTGTNTYLGGTTISDGTLQIGEGSWAGSITGDVVNNGSLVFNRNRDLRLDGIISGSGSLLQAGTGTSILTADNTYTGGTAISNGTLQLGNGGTTGSIIGDVTNNGSLAFNRSDDVVFSNIVSGDGSLVKAGAGMLTLTGVNKYTGGTTVESGTLRIIPGSAVGTGEINVDNILADPPPPILQVDSGVSLSNHIVLGADATLDNAGVLGGALDNAVEGLGYALPQIMNHDGGSIEGTGSALLLRDGGHVTNRTSGRIEGGDIAIDMWSGGTVDNDGVNSIIRSPDGVAVRISAVLGRSATVENTGGGTISAGSAAIYLPYGGEVINGSGSTIETTGTAGGDCLDAGSCSIAIGGTAVDDDSSVPDSSRQLSLTNAGTIIGDVQVNQEAANFAHLVAGGVIQGNLDLGPNSAVTMDGEAGTVQLYSQAVTGATTFGGRVEKRGDGIWIIDSDDLTIGSIGVSGGTLQIGIGGTGESIIKGGAAIAHGQLVFDRSDDVILDGDITNGNVTAHDGALVQAGSGTLTLLAKNQISLSHIIINNGTLQIDNTGGMTGCDICITMAGADIANNSSLVFNSYFAIYYSGIISGTGTVSQNGSKPLIFQAQNTYSGDTTINNGKLLTSKIMPGDVIVNSAGTLEGYSGATPNPGVPGVAGDLSNAGTVAVRFGDTTIGGAYTQAATGTLAVSLGSKLDVTGTATLDGGTLRVTGADSGYVANTHTEVLTADAGVDGTFDQLVKDTGVVFTSSTINYDANSVWLDTTGLDVTTAAKGGGVDYTPASMGSAVRVQGAFEQLDDKVTKGSLDSVPGGFVQAAGQFQQSPDLYAAQASLESLSGQLHAASAGMVLQAIDAAGRALSDRLDDADGPVGGQRRTWMRQLSQGGDMARNGFADVDYQLDGWLAGTDVRVGQHALAGFAFSQGSGMEQLAGRFDRNRSRNTEGMVYAGWTDDHWYAQGRVGMGQYRQRINRMLLLGTSYQGVWTQYDGRYNVAYGESGLRFDMGSARLTPFVDLEYDRVTRDGFAEQGAGGFGLKSGGQALSRWQGGLGLKLARQWQFAGGRSLGLDARVQWRRTLSADGAAFDASFVGLDEWRPLSGVGLSRRSAVFGLDLDARSSANSRFKLGYEYLTGDRGRGGVASARFSLAF